MPKTKDQFIKKEITSFDLRNLDAHVYCPRCERFYPFEIKESDLAHKYIDITCVRCHKEIVNFRFPN